MASSDKVIKVEDGWKDVPLKDLDERDVIGKLLKTDDVNAPRPSVEAIHENSDGIRRYYLKNAMCQGYTNTFIRTDLDVNSPRHTCFSFFCNSVATLLSSDPKLVPTDLEEDDKERKKVQTEMFVIKTKKGHVLEAEETQTGAKKQTVGISLSNEVVFDAFTVNFLSEYLGKENRDPCYPELITHMLIEPEKEKDTERELQRLEQICKSFGEIKI